MYLGKYANTLNMMGLRKHIYGLDWLDTKSSCEQKFYISDHGNGITGNIQQFKIRFFFEIANHLDDIFMETISRRIDDDEAKIIEFVPDLWCLGKCFFCRIG